MHFVFLKNGKVKINMQWIPSTMPRNDDVIKLMFSKNATKNPEISTLDLNVKQFYMPFHLLTYDTYIWKGGLSPFGIFFLIGMPQVEFL